MTFIEPEGHSPASPKLLLALLLAFVIALAVGGLIQKASSRGGLSSIARSPVESGAQRLESAELAFRQGNDSFALKMFEWLAAKNDATAQYWLAHMTELGLGAPKDIPKAISLYERAAAQNSIPAETRLGEIYLNGDLTTPNYAKAFDLLSKAAQRGDPRAAMLLGRMYRYGLGTAADPMESYAWSEVAVVEGLGFAKTEREAAFSSMSPGDRQKAAALSGVLLADMKKRDLPPAKT